MWTSLRSLVRTPRDLLVDLVLTWCGRNMLSNLMLCLTGCFFFLPIAYVFLTGCLFCSDWLLTWSLTGCLYFMTGCLFFLTGCLFVMTDCLFFLNDCLLFFWLVAYSFLDPLLIFLTGCLFVMTGCFCCLTGCLFCSDWLLMFF